MLRQALIESVSAEDLAAIGQALVRKAKEGVISAAKLIFQFVLGKPSGKQAPRMEKFEARSQMPVMVTPNGPQNGASAGVGSFGRRNVMDIIEEKARLLLQQKRQREKAAAEARQKAEAKDALQPADGEASSSVANATQNLGTELDTGR
jgi:hypothetical protein